MNNDGITFEAYVQMRRDLCLQKIGVLCDYDQYFWSIFVLLAIIVAIILFRKSKLSRKNVNPILFFAAIIAGIYTLLVMLSLYLRVKGGYLNYPWDFKGNYLDLFFEPIYRVCSTCKSLSETVVVIFTGEIQVN